MPQRRTNAWKILFFLLQLVGAYELFCNPKWQCPGVQLSTRRAVPCNELFQIQSVFKFSFLCSSPPFSTINTTKQRLIFSDQDLHLTLYRCCKQIFKTKFPVNCSALHATQWKHETGCHRCHGRNGGTLYYHVIHNRKKTKSNKKRHCKIYPSILFCTSLYRSAVKCCTIFF